MITWMISRSDFSFSGMKRNKGVRANQQKRKILKQPQKWKQGHSQGLNLISCEVVFRRSSKMLKRALMKRWIFWTWWITDFYFDLSLCGRNDVISLEKSLEFLFSHHQGNLFELFCHEFIVVAVRRGINSALVIFIVLFAEVVNDSLHWNDILTFLDGLLLLRCASF